MLERQQMMRTGECALLEVIDQTEIKVISGQLSVNGMPLLMNQKRALSAGQVYLLIALGECSFVISYYSDSELTKYCFSPSKTTNCAVVTRVLRDCV